ncbi:MAG: SAM-dependent chlorinase/fluorinase [Bacteroidales bacterium]|nr:SAM-dependent chlorinase/fluorinase [Bacteroidales bacterium]
MNLKPITITSDFGNCSFYGAAIEGKMLSLQPLSKIITISNQIRQYDIFQASVIVRNSYFHFPENSVHLILVNNFSMNTDRFVAIKQNNHYFIGSDSGIFSLLFGKTPEKIILLKNENIKSPTFPELDICTQAAVHLSEGKDIDELGSQIDYIEEATPYFPSESGNSIKGTVIFIDNYHNAITNISKQMFDKLNRNNKFTIYFGNYFTTKISKTYDYAPEADLVAVFGSTNLLEIALYKSSATNLLGIKVYDTIRIDFE